MSGGNDLLPLLAFLKNNLFRSLLLVGEDPRVEEALSARGFSLVSLRFDNRGGRPVDREEVASMRRVLEGVDEVDFVLALDGGEVANLAKVLALQFLYRGDVVDFFKREVVPYRTLPFGIRATKGVDGREKKNVAFLSDARHRFIHSLSLFDLTPSYQEASSGPKNEDLSFRLSLYLETGREDALSPLPLEKAFFLEEIGEEKRILRHLVNLVLSKCPTWNLTTALASVLPYAKEEESEALAKFLPPPPPLPENVKTKVLSRASKERKV